MRFPAEDDETLEDLYAEVWRRLDLDPDRFSELEQRRTEAERLFAELARAGPDEQRRWLGEERFRNVDLLDLLLEEGHAGQLADPARAERLSLLAARLAASLAADEPEASVALARAYCLGANARRLGGDPAGADELLARAVLFLELASERAFYSRIAALVRWEQGRLDEADALLEYAERLYARTGSQASRRLARLCSACCGLRTLCSALPGRRSPRGGPGWFATSIPRWPLAPAWLWRPARPRREIRGGPGACCGRSGRSSQGSATNGSSPPSTGSRVWRSAGWETGRRLSKFWSPSGGG
ncbi:MAG: hypothetical protein ACJ76Y_18905 [Thermoanaerobaculia bacterium]